MKTESGRERIGGKKKNKKKIEIDIHKVIIRENAPAKLQGNKFVRILALKNKQGVYTKTGAIFIQSKYR